MCLHIVRHCQNSVKKSSVIKSSMKKSALTMAAIVGVNACKCNQFNEVATYNRLLQLLFVSCIKLEEA